MKIVLEFNSDLTVYIKSESLILCLYCKNDTSKFNRFS